MIGIQEKDRFDSEKFITENFVMPQTGEREKNFFIKIEGKYFLVQ